jgi:hypothetical protein
VEEAERPAATRSWRRPGGRQACRRGRKSRQRSRIAGEEEQASPQRFFGVADSVAPGDENFWEVIAHFLRVQGHSRVCYFPLFPNICSQPCVYLYDIMVNV